MCLTFQTGQRRVASDASAADVDAGTADHFRFRFPPKDGAQTRPLSLARSNPGTNAIKTFFCSAVNKLECLSLSRFFV